MAVTRASFSDTASATENKITTGCWGPIVLNEILYNPIGDQAAGKPNGEWVELYNNGSDAVNVNGWKINDLTISILNGDNNKNPGDSGETTVPGHGFLVVYNTSSHEMFPNAGGTVNLFTDFNCLLDSHTYNGAKAAGYSDQRVPDGTGPWIDPVATPGEPNTDQMSLPKVKPVTKPETPTEPAKDETVTPEEPKVEESTTPATIEGPVITPEASPSAGEATNEETAN